MAAVARGTLLILPGARNDHAQPMVLKASDIGLAPQLKNDSVTEARATSNDQRPSGPTGPFDAADRSHNASAICTAFSAAPLRS